METNKQIAIISSAEVNSATEVLATTQSWVAAYQKKEAILLEQATKEGDKLSPETDQKINDFLASVKKAIKAAEDNRKPFTTKLQTITKLFTAEENALTSLMKDLQIKRNTSASIYAKEAAEKARKDQLVLDRKHEEIRLFAEAEQYYRDAYASLLNNDKGELFNALEGATLETIAGVEDLLKSVTGNLEPSIWNSEIAKLFPTYLSEDEAGAIAIKAKEGKFDKIAPHYKAEIKDYAEHLLSMVPERIRDLEDGKESEALAELKRKEEEIQEAQNKLSENRTQQEVANATATATIDMQIEQHKHNLNVPKVQTKGTYEIEVLNIQGWMEIANFYFLNAPNLDAAELGKVKLDSMKLFAERIVKSDGLMVESTNVLYHEVIKAVTKSKRAA